LRAKALTLLMEITMAVSLHCPNCGEDLGKDTENPMYAYCDNCGEDKIENERGYRDED